MQDHGAISDAPLRSRSGPLRCRNWTTVLDRGIRPSGGWGVGKHCAIGGRIRRQVGSRYPFRP